MPEQEATITPVAFEDVAVGDTLTFQTRDNGFSGSGGFVQRTGKVTQVTERSVTVACGHSLNYVPGSSTGNARLRRADWYDRHVQRVDLRSAALARRGMGQLSP